MTSTSTFCSVVLVSEARREPKQKRSIRTRDRLLEAARRQFAERGYRETQSGDIAQNAGVSVGTFYEYFSDKRTAYLMVIRELFDAILSIDFADPFAKEPVTTRWYRLIDLFRVLDQRIKPFGRLESDIPAVAADDELIRSEMESFEKDIVTRLADIIIEGISSDSAERVDTAAYLIWAVIRSAIQRTGNGDSFVAEASFAIDRYLVALGR